jgi:hypothetical protein
VSIPTGIAKDFGGGIYRTTEFPAVGFAESAAPQQPKQFSAGRPDFALDFGNGFAVSLDFDRFPALDDSVQDRFAAVGQLCGTYNHEIRIAILAILTILS